MKINLALSMLLFGSAIMMAQQTTTITFEGIPSGTYFGENNVTVNGATWTCCYGIVYATNDPQHGYLFSGFPAHSGVEALLDVGADAITFSRPQSVAGAYVLVFDEGVSVNGVSLPKGVWTKLEISSPTPTLTRLGFVASWTTWTHPFGYPSFAIDDVYFSETPIAPPLVLSCPTSSATVNVPYASAFAASGGTGTFSSYAIATGSLPPVLTLSSVGGVSGTPTTAGPYSFTGRVTDSSGATATSPTCSITVAPAPCTISIAPSSRAFPAHGGFGEVLFGFVSVTASDSTCQWTYKKLDNVDWLNCTACDVGFTAHGTATIQYTVADNTSSGPARVARIRFEDANNVAQDHTVQQAGIGCGRSSDGCSIPTAALGAAEGFLAGLGQFNPVASGCLDPNNPACGTNTRFSFGGPGGNLACDNHDYCYGTYSGALSGPIYDNWKRYCDSQLRADALRACDAAEQAHEPAAIVSNCRTLASAYGLGVSAFGDTIVSGYAYSTAQQAAYSCTPYAPAPDGSIGPSGGTVTDNLFNSLAQISVPQGAINATRDVTISVLDQSPPSIGLPSGFRRAATFFVQFTFEPALPSQTLGSSITLPLVTRLAAGTQVSLYRIDDATQTLVPVLNPGSTPITGVVDPGEYSALFTGTMHFSTLVGLLAQPAIAGDVNDDLRVDCVDVRLVQSVLGKRTADPGYDARADVNHDGIIDIRDLSFVSQRLPAGTRCQ